MDVLNSGQALFRLLGYERYVLLTNLLEKKSLIKIKNLLSICLGQQQFLQGFSYELRIGWLQISTELKKEKFKLIDRVAVMVRFAVYHFQVIFPRKCYSSTSAAFVKTSDL